MIRYLLTPRYVTPVHVEGKKPYAVVDPDALRPYTVWLRDSEVKAKRLQYQKQGKILRGQNIKPLAPRVRKKKGVKSIEGEEAPKKVCVRFHKSKYLTTPLVCMNTGKLYPGLLEAANAINANPARLYDSLVMSNYPVRTYLFRKATAEEIKKGKMIGEVVPFKMPQNVPVFVNSLNQWFASAQKAYETLGTTKYLLKVLVARGEAKRATGDDIRTIDFEKLFSEK